MDTEADMKLGQKHLWIFFRCDLEKIEVEFCQLLGKTNANFGLMLEKNDWRLKWHA